MKNELPEHVLSILNYNDYDIPLSENVISVTSLIDAPHYRQLSLKYPDEKVDPENLIMSMYGSIGHSIVERSDRRTVRELRIDHELTMNIEENGKRIPKKMILTGKFDNYDPRTKTLYDNKFVHHNSLKYPSTKLKWEQQMNIYAFLMKEEFGWEVDKLVVIVWVRDMTAIDVVKSDYPDATVFPLELELWDYTKQYFYVHERMRYHLTNKSIGCTPYERWATDKMWSVIKGNNVRAYRNFTDKKEAAKLLLKLRKNGKKGYRIEFRKPADRRCKTCKFASKCEYHLAQVSKEYDSMFKDL